MRLVGSGGNDGPERPPLPQTEQVPCSEGLLVMLQHLCEHLTLQTEAINRLAASNEALVEALMTPEDEDTGLGGPSHLGARQ